jgi:protocatechuate 3,4-dioxygenase beta subunit
MLRNVIVAGVVAIVLATLAILVFVFKGREPREVVGPPAPPPVQKTGPAPPPDKVEAPPAIAAKTSPAPGPAKAAPALGQARIGGRVISEESRQPIAGAAVRIALDLPEKLPRRAPWIQSVLSDSEGRFRFDGLTPVHHRLQVSAPAALDAIVDGVSPGEDVEVRLRAAAGVACRVVLDLEDGERPLTDQLVILELPDIGWSLETRTDAQGMLAISGIEEADLERLVNLVDVVVDGYADPRLFASAAGAPAPYTIAVDPGLTVFGQVRDQKTGKPIAGAVVVSDYGHQVSSDAGGNYRIAGVEEGVNAFAPGYALVTASLDEDEAADADPGTPLRLDIGLVKGVTLFGSVIDAGGKPIPGVQISPAPDAFTIDFNEERLDAVLRRQLTGISDAQGRYRIEGLPAEELSLPMLVEFELRMAGSGGSMIVDVDIDVEDGEFRKDFVVDLVGEVGGVLRRENGDPVGGAKLIAESAGESLHVVSAASDRDGRFSFRDLPAGDYQMVVEHEGVPVLVAKFTAPASAPLDLRLPPSRAARGVVVSQADGAPLAGVRARLLVFAGHQLQVPLEARSAADGSFAIEGVPAGVFTLELSRPGPAQPFNPYPAQHQERLDLSQGDWKGGVLYPGLPSGTAVFHFFVKRGSGAIEPLEAHAEVEVAYYRLDRLRVGSPTGARRGVKVAEGSGSAQVRLRVGEYAFRCGADVDGRRLAETVNLTLADGATSESEVVFKSP